MSWPLGSHLQVPANLVNVRSMVEVIVNRESFSLMWIWKRGKSVQIEMCIIFPNQNFDEIFSKKLFSFTIWG